jgi:hypothetical protein
MKLNALERRPWVKHDWSEQLLRDVARWANWSLRSGISFERYRRSARADRGRDAAAANGELFL